MKTKKCSSCSKAVSVSAKFCPECGQAQVKEVSESSPKTGFRWKEFGIVGGVVLAISVGFFVFTYSKRQPVPEPTQMQGEVPTGHGDMGATLPEFPKDYVGLVATGDQFMNQNNFAIAAESYKRALLIDGSSPDVRSDFASCLFGMGLTDRAITEFRSIRKSNPLHAVTLFNMGVVFLGQEKLDSAKYYFAEYLEMEPTGKAAEQARNYMKQLGT